MKPTVLVIALLLVTAVGLGAGAAVNDDETDEEANDGAFGDSVSSFMQASAAETETDVDERMFGAALERTDAPDELEALIEARAERLEQRADRLEELNATIVTDPANATPRDRALAVRLGVEAAGLERSANATVTVADEAGVDRDRIADVRDRARGIRGGPAERVVPGNGSGSFAGPGDASPGQSERPGANGPDRSNESAAPGGDSPVDAPGEGERPDDSDDELDDDDIPDDDLEEELDDDELDD